MKIKDKILNCFAIAFISLLFLFAFTWIIFYFQSSANSLKDTWTIVSSLFGGIATLTAAYIASLLFSDWRDNYNANIRRTLIEEALHSCNLHEANIFESIEKVGSVKAKLQFELESRKNLIYRIRPKANKNCDNILSPIQNSHSSFLWGKNILWKNLLCLQNNGIFSNEIDISAVIEKLHLDSINISNVYLAISTNDNIQVKINKTNELNTFLANYLSFVNLEIYLPLSALRFESIQKI